LMSANEKDRRTKICFIANWFHPHVGGSAINVGKYATEVSRFHDVTILTPKRYEGPDVEDWHGIKVIRFWNANNSSGKLPYRESEACCPGILFHLLTHKYDLVHCWPMVAANARLALLAKRIRRFPIFISIFDMVPYNTMELERFPDPEIIRKYYPKPGLLTRMKQFVSFGSFNALFFIADAEKDFVRENYNPNCYWTPVPLDIPEFDSGGVKGGFKKKFGLEGVDYLVYTGRITPHKGQDQFIESAPFVLKRFPAVKFVVVGPTDDEAYFGRIQDRIRELGIEDSVIFTGSLSRQDLINSLLDCAMQVITVRFMNAGAVVTETWAAHRPVIQTDRIDPNLVTDGVDGYTCSFGDHEAIAQRICELLADPAKADRMGEAGRGKIEKDFSYAAVTRQRFEVYRKHGWCG